MKIYKVNHQDDRQENRVTWFGYRDEARKFAREKGIAQGHSDGVLPVEINTERETLVNFLNTHAS